MVCGILILLLSLALMPLAAFAATPAPPCIIGSEGDCTVSPSTGAKKWHPGHYMQYSVGDSVDKYQSMRFNHYDEIASNTQIKGVTLRYKWGALESSKDVYTFDVLNAEIAKLQSLSAPKQLFIRIIDRDYGAGGQPCEGSSTFPAYMQSTGCTVTTNGNVARIWDPAVAARLIALYQAMAAEWDDNPGFEGLYLIRETAKNGQVVDDPTFSQAAYSQGVKDIVTAADAAFVKSNAVISLNWMGGTTEIGSILDHVSTTNVGFGGPDVMPSPQCANFAVDADNVFTGNVGGTDYRGAIPSIRSTETSQMGGSLGDCMPGEIRDWANEILHASHLMWTRQNYTGSSAQQWTTGVLPYINNPANNLTRTSCPANYTQGCETD